MSKYINYKGQRYVRVDDYFEDFTNMKNDLNDYLNTSLKKQKGKMR